MRLTGAGRYGRHLAPHRPVVGLPGGPPPRGVHQRARKVGQRRICRRLPASDTGVDAVAQGRLEFLKYGRDHVEALVDLVLSGKLLAAHQ